MSRRARAAADTVLAFASYTSRACPAAAPYAAVRRCRALADRLAAEERPRQQLVRYVRARQWLLLNPQGFRTADLARRSRPAAVTTRNRFPGKRAATSSLPNIRAWRSGGHCMARARRCLSSGRSSGRRALSSRHRVFPARGGNACLRRLVARSLWVRPAHLGCCRSFPGSSPR